MDRFNDEFGTWMRRSGCVANFAWSYDRESGQKMLKLTEIDMMIYRSSAPTEADVRAALDKVGKENPET